MSAATNSPTPRTTYPLIYTVDEAATLLGFHHDALYRAIKDGTFRSSTGKPAPADALRWVRTAKRISIPKAAVADFLGLTIAECDGFLATGAIPEVQQSRGPQYAARWRNFPQQQGGR